jgi:subtilase family serine protease
VPEINSPGVTKSLATEEEIKTTATKYLDKMCFTVLYTVSAYPLWKYAVLAVLTIVVFSAVSLWRRMYKPRE